MENSELKKVAYLILGMHRSGTSTISGILNIMGLELGKHPNWPNESNPKGFFENYSLQLFNEHILEKLDTNWHNTLRIPAKWWKFEKMKPDVEILKDLFRTEYENSETILIKDPRISILLPLYLCVMQEIRIKPNFIICFRNPLEVAASLLRRDQFPPSKSILLWMDYMLKAEYYTRNFRRIFIDFNSVVSDSVGIINLIKKYFSLTISINDEVKSKITSFVDPGLKHYNIDTGSYQVFIPDEIKELYMLFLKFKLTDIDETTIPKIDIIRNRFAMNYQFYNGMPNE